MDFTFDKDRATAWWERLCGDEEAMNEWLVRLQKTELQGYQDNLDIIAKYDLKGLKASILTKTAEDEKRHSDLLIGVLEGRGLSVPDPESIPDSLYWAGMETYVENILEREFAVLYFGEALASARFKVIQEHPQTPLDVKAFIDSALPDEMYHAEGFKRLSTTEALEHMAEAHRTVLDGMTAKYAA